MSMWEDQRIAFEARRSQMVSEAIEKDEGVPKATLSTFDVVAIIVGIVVGAGIFKTPSLIAANVSDIVEMLALWMIGGALSFVGALCYAELATTYPNAGGDYHYLHRAFGRGVSFLFVWARMTVIQTGSIAFLAFVFGDYASQLVRLGPHSAAIYAGAVVLALTMLNVAGIDPGKSAQNLLTSIEICGLLSVIVAGLILVAPMADGTDAVDTIENGGHSIGLAMVFVLLTYGGWNEAAYVSAEIRGERRIAWALFVSLGLITALYVLANLAYWRALGLAGMVRSDVVAADLMRRAVGEGGGRLISLIIALSALTSANATVITGARAAYAVGRDYRLFGFLGRWDERAGTPVNALIAQGAVALALVIFGAMTRDGFTTIVEYTAPVFWLFFLLTGVALLVLRVKEKERQRPFTVPLYPVVPLIFCASSAYMLHSSLRYTGIGAVAGVAVLACGLPIFGLARKRA
jgi:APA family basic amino acid/polyamine antiporter